MRSPDQTLPWVVGIGASAGGLEALTAFIANLPEQLPGVIVIAQHLAPKSKSMMAELLGRQAALPVTTAVDGQRLEAGGIYIVPPNVDIDIEESRISLKEAGPETRPKPSVDTFFHSLARSYGERAVGIILSGTGTDGSEGVRAIRARGGVTIAQDGASAKYDGMPQAAIQTGSVDAILSPEEIARNINDVLNTHFSRKRSDAIGDEVLLNVLARLKKTGRDFTEYKLSTIRRRFAKRLAILGLNDPQSYIELLERTPGEAAALAQDLLVSVTCFFRDSEIWDGLKQAFADVYEKKTRGEEFRVWIAGCATGEEAYSIAMVLAELQAKHDDKLTIKIFATDLDQEAILEARNGVYAEEDLKKVPQHYRSRYFNERAAGRFEITKDIRDRVVFARQDLVQNPPFVKLDFITCRNVLIYFEPTLQKRVIETFHYALASSGILVLGKSETPVGCTHLFDTIDKKAKLYVKLQVAPRLTPSLSMPRSGRQELARIPNAGEKKSSVSEKAYAALIESYGLAGAVVDGDGTVIHWMGDVAPYIKVSSGSADFRLPSLLRRDLSIELPILLKKASKEKGVFHSRTHEIEALASTPGFQFRISVRALPEEGRGAHQRGLFLVNFERLRAVETPAPPSVFEEDLPIRYSELERELFQTREHLQTVIEELGVTNEELQSLNEELSSTNEELQASNEELETTNEELQSSNEELTTLNEELAVKSGELRQFNTELSNVYSSIGSPLVVIDKKLQILRYNEDALKIFNFNAKSIGEDVTRVSANCELPDFKEKLLSTMKDSVVNESICEGLNSIYQLRMVPYIDDSKRVIGAILVFFDNTSFMRTKKLLETSESRVTAILAGSPSLISLKDRFGRYILANPSFAHFFGLEPEDIIGKTDNEIFSREQAGRLRDADLEILLKGQSIHRQEILLGTRGESRESEGHFFVTRFPLVEPDAQEPYAVGTIAVNISAQVAAQNALRESEMRYRAIVEEQSVFVCRFGRDGKFSYLNSAFSQFFSISPAKGRDVRFQDYVASVDETDVRWVLENLSPSSPTAQHDHRWQAEGAENTRWLRWIYRGLFDAEGEITEYQAVGFDVTETKTQTNQLIEKEAVFKSLFSNTSDLMAIFRIVDGDLVLESLNRSAEKSYGFAYNQLIGRNQILDRYRVAVDTGTAQVVEEDVSLLGQRRQLLTTIVPIPGGNGAIERIAAVSRDVSAYKEIERNLRKAMELADVANQAKSDFLASMSHELRTPLNVGLGMAHLLGDSQIDDEQREYVGSINRSGQLLLSLIEDVLDISRIESGRIRLNVEPFRIGEIAREVRELFSIQASEKGITLSVNVDAESDLYVLGDASRLRQVIVNLVGNAIKFTDYGRVDLTIRTTGEEIAGEQHFRFKVTDTGVGMKKEFHSKIFQKFSQADSGDARKYGGSGLGLVISKHLVSLMNGEIDFESVYGEGTTFWFTVRLQLTTQAEAESRRARIVGAGRVAKWEHRALKVLAVDDNIDSLNVVRLFLKRLGHEVTTESGGQEAIASLAKNKFDLVLMDVQMPVMDGLETTRKIRSLDAPFSKIPIIALTAKAMSGDADRCFDAGMSDYLTKPVQMKALKSLLARWAMNLSNDPARFEN